MGQIGTFSYPEETVWGWIARMVGVSLAMGLIIGLLAWITAVILL
jgi:hypothetical protein